MMELLPETRVALAEIVSFEDPDVDELLHDLGEQARHIVPALVGLSLGLASEGLTLTMVASGTAPAALDSAPYLDGGPCVEVAEGRSESLEVRLDDPLDEERWGRTHASARRWGSRAVSPCLSTGEDTGWVGSTCTPRRATRSTGTTRNWPT
jgi:hypothetical protein